MLFDECQRSQLRVIESINVVHHLELVSEIASISSSKLKRT